LREIDQAQGIWERKPSEMTHDERLIQALRIQFGTSYYEPNASQLLSIKSEIQKIQAAGRTPSEGDWRAAVSRFCPSAGKHKYAGLDNSDLNTLLEMASKLTGR
jgi:hypothetical protein